MLGQKSVFAGECFKGGYIGVDFNLKVDLTNKKYDNFKSFNHDFIPILLKENDKETKVSAGLRCGFLYTVAVGMQIGDVVLSPKGNGSYYVGEISGGYSYHPDSNLPHQRQVKWFDNKIERSEMSDSLRHSTGSIGTLSNITKYEAELEKLIGTQNKIIISTNDVTIEDPSVFALEKHLEDFLIANWKHTELGKTYDIYKEGDEIIGQQYPTDTGDIDILAISKDKKNLLVIELKKGRASDNVVGQIQRYMGFVKEELAEVGQSVKGIIIAFDDDLKIKRALSVNNNIEFYRYQITFKLIKG